MKKITLCLLLTGILFASCRKNADFSTNQPEYGPGEIIQLKNVNNNKNGHRWILPDGTTQSSKDASWEVPFNQPSGKVLITLEENPIFGRKTSVTKAITIGGAGTVSAWKYSQGTSMYITINGQKKAIIPWFDNQTYYEGPKCTDPNITKFTLEAGYYTYVIESTNGINTAGISVKRGGCTLLQTY